MLKPALSMLSMGSAVIAFPPPPPAVRSLYGHWHITHVAVPRNGVQAIGTDDPDYVGQRLTFTPRRLSWDKPNPSYGGTVCDAPVIRPVRAGRQRDERIAGLRARVIGSFSVRCAGGSWGPADPPAPEVLALSDGTIALWWFDSALLTLRRVG